MLKNYFKLAIRNIQRHTSYAVINLLGLSIGFGASIIIGLYALDILTFNAVHEKKDQIYLAYKERLTPSGTQATYDTWIPMAQRLQSDFPEITKTSTSYQTEAMVISSTQEYIREAITYTDESFFQIFTFQSIRNNPNYFDGRYSAVITENMARKYFPNQNAIGNELEIFLSDEDTTMRFMVSSVVKNLPTNAAPDAEIFIPFEGIPAYKEFQNNWNSSFSSTWVLLEGQDPLALESRLADLVTSIWDAETASRTNFRLLPLAEYYDTFIGDSEDAWIMMGIAIGILLIASINFMNLATARSTYRAKEIGLRKVLGAIAPQIRIQFFMESVIYTIIALGIAMIIVFFALPYVNTFFELNLDFFQLISIYGLLALLGITLFIGILSGSYPAFFLSTISVIQVLRKSGITGGARSFRNALIVVQFGLAVLLICGALLIRNQLMYMYQKDMGFDSEQLLFIEASTDNFSDREVGASRINTFKKNLGGYSFVEEMTSSRSIPTEWTRSFTFVRSKGWTGDPLRMRYTYVDANFFNTYNIEIVEGRNFLDDLQGHQRESVILNRAAFEDLNLDTAIAPTLVFGSREIKVVGIADNFNFESLRNEIAPTLHFHRTAEHPVHNYVSIKLSSGNMDEIISTIENEWSRLDALTPLNYRFADQSVEAMYESEKQFLGMLSFFTIISILIACLGLYGLTVFVIEKKQKEISIRKVVGASLSQISLLIAWDFLPWIGLALLLGGMGSYSFFETWVENFHYQAPFNYLLFILAAVIVLLLVGVTVSFHTIKAATSNPVKYLRED